MSPQDMNRRLESMKGKTFMFVNEAHTIQSFWINESAKQFQVETDKLKIKRTFDNAYVFFSSFKPVDQPAAEAPRGIPRETPKEAIAAKTTTVEGKYTPSSVIVYSTTDYSRFRMINGNRQINIRKVNKIIKEIESGNDMLRYYPIQVKEWMEQLDILDGQHRFYIDQKLKRPVYFILVEEEKTMPDIAKVNSNVEKWKSDDFINCYIQQENSDYSELKAFMETYDFSATMAVRLLQKGEPGVEGSSADLMESFRHGKFEVMHAAAAYTLAEECKMFSTYKGWNERGFVIALYRVKKAGLITIEDLLASFKKRPEMLTSQKSYKEYIWNFEQIINVGKQKRLTII
jgi:hypothetical protein